MFNKILVPLDGSDLAGKVLPKAENLANCFGSQLVLLTAGSEEVGEIGESSPEVKTEAVARMPAVKYLEATAAALRAKNLAATWVFKQGDPAEEIINYAGAHQMESHPPGQPWRRRGRLAAGQRGPPSGQPLPGPGAVAAGLGAQTAGA